MEKNFFDAAFEELMILEGGYVNNPNDPGGETNFGICKRSYPDLDIKNLTKDIAKEIYFKDFWEPYHYDQIKEPSLAKSIFHNTVNCGPNKSHLLVQRALRACNLLPNLDVLTLQKEIDFIAIINEVIEKDQGYPLYLAIKSESASFRRAIPISNPKTEVFIKGWLRRAYEEVLPREEIFLPPNQVDKNSLSLEGVAKDLWDEANYQAITSKELSAKLLKTSLDFLGDRKEPEAKLEALNDSQLLLQRALRSAGLLPKEVRERDNLIINLNWLELINKLDGKVLLPAFRSELAGFYRLQLLTDKQLSNKELVEEKMLLAYDD
jgi:hypothetical protein